MNSNKSSTNHSELSALIGVPQEEYGNNYREHYLEIYKI
jgi:hypothetical protein